MTTALPRSLLAALAALGIALTVTVVPGVFTVDANNYLVNVVALRQGRVTVPNTDGLPPSRELLFFEPGPWSRSVTSTPVASNAPPLYAPIALPFSLAGWRGLVALNTLSYLATAALVFWYAARYTDDKRAPWLAASAFALCGWAMEYAQGVWPQALSFALCTAGVVAAGEAIERAATGAKPFALAAASGFLLAVAAGVRYQNAVMLGATGAAIVWLSPRQRFGNASAFTFAALPPLAVSAALNHARLGSWNPISKGGNYLSVSVSSSGSVWIDPVVMAWARLIDISVRPPLQGPHFDWVDYDPETGAHLMGRQTFQKSLLQSAPWAILGMALLVLVWTPLLPIPAARRRQLRLLSIPAAALVIVLSAAGPTRHAGLVFNQRYLLEVLPLLAVAFAWSLAGVPLSRNAGAVGALAGIAIVLALLTRAPTDVVRGLAVLRLPLVLAAALGVSWALFQTRPRLAPAIAVLAGVCLGWGLALHVGDDVRASAERRTNHQLETAALRAALPDNSALVCYGGTRDAAGPLLLERDVVVIDLEADDGEDAPVLIRELLARGRRVFFSRYGVPEPVAARISEDYALRRVPQPGLVLFELSRRP